MLQRFHSKNLLALVPKTDRFHYWCNCNVNDDGGGSGYMAPEYAMDGTVSFMQDVYSFGVLLLEIVSGRRNQRSFNLIAHVSIYMHAPKTSSYA